MTYLAKPAAKAKKANHYRRNKTRERNMWIRELDEAARRDTFERDYFRCIWCGSERNIQWAHVLSRRAYSTRWLPDNSMTLCAGCHLFWHHEPAVALDWFFKNFRIRWERLQLVRRVNAKPDIKALWEELHDRVGNDDSGQPVLAKPEAT